MTTVQLLIICVTVLAGLGAVLRAVVSRDSARAQLQRETAMHERDTASRFADLADAVRALTAAADTIRAAAGTTGPSRVGHRVTVHTKKPDDQTLFGVVVGDYIDRLVLEDCEYVTAHGSQPIPGTQHVATEDVAWLDLHAAVTIPERPPAEVGAR